VIGAVFLDVGETLVDETRLWGEVADAVGVTRLTFFATLGVVIERREDHRRVFDLLGVERAPAPPIEARDFYPDAVSCLRELRAEGYCVGLAANQPGGTEAFLRGAGLAVDVVAGSETWGVAKPSPAFFDRLVEVAGRPPAEIAYVGDRIDNDVLPARAAGLAPIFVRRGPWGLVHASWPEVDQAAARIESLAELPEALRGL
jgi:FMN phosphatase YigB (HAD superfamily)